VLAAPGQSIMSTVPDYLYSHDGVPNDYASATGTSMAAPYVAGASVLVRQAMQQAGYTTINEDTIYNVLKMHGRHDPRFRYERQLLADQPAAGDRYGRKQLAAGLGNVGLSAIDRPPGDGRHFVRRDRHAYRDFHGGGDLQQRRRQRRHRSSRCQQQSASQQRDRVEQRTGRM